MSSNESRPKRPVLIVVPAWPNGTMAIKFGNALMTALGVKRREATLMQFAPERIFKVVTAVTESEFRERLAMRKLGSPVPLDFIEVKPQVESRRELDHQLSDDEAAVLRTFVVGNSNT